MSSSPGGSSRRRWTGAAAWAAAAALAAGAAPLRTLHTRGPALVLVHAADLLAVAALLCLCRAIGDGLLIRSGVSFFGRRERLPFAVALGAGALATSLLVACALLGVHSWVIGLVLGAGAVAAGEHLAALLPSPAQRAARREAARPDRLPPSAAIALGVTAAVLLVLALAPPADWDSLMYHILAPSRWLHDGRISTLGGMEHVAFVGLVHVLYLPLLAIGSVSGPAVLSAALALLLGLEAFSFARRLFGAGTAAYSAVLVWGTPTILLVACTARVDVSVALFLLLAHDALLTAWRERSPRHLDLAALLLGLSVGAKYQAGAYALALAPLVLAAAVRQRAGFRPTVATLARVAGLAFCAAAPWLLKNQLLFGAPFYPFLAHHRTEPWLTPLLGNGAAGITLDPRVYLIQQTARADFNLRDAFLNPGALSVGGEAGFYFLNPLLVLVPLCLFAVRDVNLLALAGPSLLYALGVLAVSPRTNLRYLIPGIVPLTVACAAVLVAGTNRLPRVVRWALRTLVVAVALVPTVGTMHIWLSRNHVVADVAGLISGEDYLAGNASPVVRSHLRVTREANRLLVPGDTVLMIFESRGLYLNAPAIEDTKLTNWASLAAALGLSRCLEGSGITHVLARQSAARYYVERGAPDAAIGMGAFERFAARCLTPAYADSGATLYIARQLR